MKRILVPAVMAISLLAAPAIAKDHVVKMLTKGKSGMMVFEPAFVKAAPGDTVRFMPTEPTHNAETIKTMLPDGVVSTTGAMNKEFTLKVTKPGIYGIKCKPHYAMGMIALVQVGNGPSANLAAAKAVKHPGLAAKRMTPLLARAK